MKPPADKPRGRVRQDPDRKRPPTPKLGSQIQFPFGAHTLLGAAKGRLLVEDSHGDRWCVNARRLPEAS
jgi:hypothetical protein